MMEPVRLKNDDRISAAAAHQVGASAASAYSWRPPSPPHIHVPPTSEDKQVALPQYVGSASQLDHEILKHITQGNWKVEVKEWKYTWRRTAQPILAFLYLGPASVAMNLEWLHSEGITMMLVIRNSLSGSMGLYTGKKAQEQLGIPTAVIDVDGNQQLIARMKDATKIINQHLVEQFHVQGGVNKPTDPNADPNASKTWGKVLLYCESGNERSPAIAVAYLMEMYNMDLIAAIQYVQQARFCVAFDDALKNLLQTYDDILNATRAVTPRQITARPNFMSQMSDVSPAFAVKPPASKRGRDDIDEDAMDMDAADDESRFGGRTVFVPFVQRD